MSESSRFSFGKRFPNKGHVFAERKPNQPQETLEKGLALL